jgi:carboxymethylenebutenolidase
VPEEEINAIKAAHAAQPDVEVYVYPGGKHGFAQSDSAAYDAAMTHLAEERTLTMLARIA